MTRRVRTPVCHVRPADGVVERDQIVDAVRRLV
jgi:hypothetical protein